MRAATLLGEHRLDEAVGIERLDVLGPLAHADELHGNVELLADRDHDASARGAVELGEEDYNFDFSCEISSFISRTDCQVFHLTRYAVM